MTAMETKAYDNKAFDSIRETKEKRTQRKAERVTGKGLVTIRVIRPYAGIPVGHTQVVKEKSANTLYMIDNGYWEVE